MLNSAQKLKKIREVLDEIPTVYPVYTFNDVMYVKVEHHQTVHDALKAIAKIVGVRF